MKSDAGIASSIKSTVKTLRVLKLFSREKNVWSVQDMMKELGFHKSSVQRIVTTLEAEGFLSRVAEGKGFYRLGPVILYLGNLAEVSTDLRSIAQPVMRRLVETVQETAYLCVLAEFQSLYIEIVECSQPIRIMHTVGKRNPLHCTGVGKVLLSGMTPEGIDRVISRRGLTAYTQNTITDRGRLLEEIETVRVNGLAYDNQELDIGVRCIAAPIFNRDGNVAAGLSISGPVQRLTPEKVSRFETVVKMAAAEISFKLGFVGESAVRKSVAEGETVCQQTVKLSR
jgi:DNA-binding IclR family transcriptional regulator